MAGKFSYDPGISTLDLQVSKGPHVGVSENSGGLNIDPKSRALIARTLRKWTPKLLIQPYVAPLGCGLWMKDRSSGPPAN